MRDLVKAVVAFRDRRDWRQFHHPKDLAISIALEAAELLEHFQWKNPDEVRRYLRQRRNRDRVAAEMARSGEIRREMASKPVISCRTPFS